MLGPQDFSTATRLTNVRTIHMASVHMALCAFFSWAGRLSQSRLLPHTAAPGALRAQEPVPEPEPGGAYAELSGARVLSWSYQEITPPTHGKAVTKCPHCVENDGKSHNETTANREGSRMVFHKS